MKKYLYILMAMVAMVATGCREKLTELDKGSTPLAIHPDKDRVVLDQTEYNSDGLRLQWTTGTNEGTGHRIYYRLEVKPAGLSWEEALVLIDDAEQVYEYVWKVDDVNTMILDSFGLPFEQEASLTARVSAYGEGFKEQVAECDFVVLPYKPITRTLYLSGKAVCGSWKPADAVEMEMREIGYFKKTLVLQKGEFKLLCSNESQYPSYMPGETEEDVVLRESSAQPNRLWKITEDHLYEISVNLITLKITIKQVTAERPEFDNLYLIGNETGWNFWEMQVDPLDPFLFRIGHYWTLGKDFKFGTASGAWENNYKATSADAPYTQESMVFIKGYDPDNKWYLKPSELDKMYKICVDIHTGQERMIMREFTPFTEMYLVGDAAPGGWNLDDAEPMTAVDDTLFTWTGNLKVGELKFSCDKQSDWNGAWFMPVKSSSVPTGEKEAILFVDKHEDSITRYQYAQSADVVVSDIDIKWSITEAGKYTITLDQLHECVTIVKQ